MNTRAHLGFAAAFFLTLGMAMAGPASAQTSLEEIRWDRYHTYEEVTRILHLLQEARPDLITLESAGPTTVLDWDIWAATLTNPETGPPGSKPGYYLDGGTHDWELGGSQTALYTAWYLTTRYGEDPEVTKLLDTRTIYIIPRKDAVGMEYHLTRQLPYDPADLPARFQNRCTDPPSDITGNGEILEMRYVDPHGRWVIDSDDPRIMRARRHGDEGPFYTVIQEGIDENGDGRVNSDPCPRFSTNRNYPARWADDLRVRRGAGDYPTQEPETRATVDFVIARPNIGAMESLHHYSGVILRPFTNLADDAFPDQDLAYYDAIAQRGREITDYGYVSVFNEFTADQENPRFGVQVDWGYLDLGIIAFTTEQWRYAGNVGPTAEWTDQRHTPEVMLARSDREFGGAHFVEWESFEHPDLGPVEIGGWTQFGMPNPPPEIMEEQMMRPMLRWILYQASTTPLVRIQSVEVEALGEGASRITVEVANEGFLPTNVTEQAIRAGIAQPVVARISTASGVRLLDASPQVVLGHLEGTPAVVREVTFGTQSFGGNNRARASWVVQGSGSVTVEAVSQKGGRHARTVEVEGVRREGGAFPPHVQ